MRQETYSHSPPIPAAIFEEINPIFKALSSTDLLSGYKHGGTQNQNESFNSLIWQRATKHTHSTYASVYLATSLAIGHFNDGARCLQLILSELNIEPGVHLGQAVKKIDKRRLYFANIKSSKATRKRRKALRHKRKGYIDALEEEEGVQYEAGAF